MAGGYDKFWSAFQPDARISPSTFGAGAKAPGEPRLIFLRPPQNDDDDPFPDPDEEPPPDDPCAGRPLVHPALIAAQLRLDVGGKQRDCPSPADLDRLKAAVRARFTRIVPDADVRVACNPPILTIGVWPAWNGANACEDQARQRGLERLDLLVGAQAFAFFLRRSLILFLAARGFEFAPKQLSGNGAPSLIGPIHLTGLTVEFVEPDTIVTRVTGYDDRPLPDVGFTLTITDRILASGAVDTPPPDLDTHGAWKAILAGWLLIGGAALLPPLLIPVISGVEALLSGRDPGGTAGVGERILGLVPKEIALPGRTKLIVFYNTPQPVTPGGLFMGGDVFEQPRQPAAALAGPRALVAPDGAREVAAEYAVSTADTFGTLTFTWQPAAGITVARPSSQLTTITFSLRDVAEPEIRRTLRATVADQDGFVQEVTRTVEIFIADPDGLPPICRKHPSLPQCRPRTVDEV